MNDFLNEFNKLSKINNLELLITYSISEDWVVKVMHEGYFIVDVKERTQRIAYAKAFLELIEWVEEE